MMQRQVTDTASGGHRTSERSQLKEAGRASPTKGRGRTSTRLWSDSPLSEWHIEFGRPLLLAKHLLILRMKQPN